MAETTFNEAERYLLEHWTTTIEVEESIDEVRNKYQGLCEKVAETIRENHPELDGDRVEVTRESGTAVKSGVIVLYRSSWPREGKYPTGLWVENLRLEILADAKAPPPMIGLWHNDDSDDDGEEGYDRAQKKIKDAARKALTAEQLKIWKEGDNDDTAIIGKPLSSKREILDMLAKGDGEQFVSTLVEHFDVLARLIPAIDAAFAKNR